MMGKQPIKGGYCYVMLDGMWTDLYSTQQKRDGCWLLRLSQLHLNVAMSLPH